MYFSNRSDVAGLMILVAIIFVIQLANLQILNKTYKENADSNAFLKKIQYPARGLIYDRKGRLLVYNKPAYDVMIVMKEVLPFDTIDFCNAVNINKAQFIKLVEEIKRDRGTRKKQS